VAAAAGNSTNGRTFRRARAAFTLLEVLVATLILAGGIVGVLATFSLGVRAASRAEQLERAVQVATNEMESAVSAPAGATQPRTGSVGRYTWEVDYAEKPHRLVLATVRVTWSEDGKPQTFHLSQLFTPPEASGEKGAP
jgi:type II secretory pathway pseudopilin PulG